MKITEKFKKLSFKDKLDYLWDYYKVPIIGAVSAIVLVIYILYLIFRHVPEDILNVTLINSGVSSEDEIVFDDEYLLFTGLDPENYQVSLGTHITIDNGMSSRSREFVAAKILAEEIDVLVWDETAYGYVKTLGASSDLSNYLPEEYVQKYDNYAVYENGSLIGFVFDGNKEISKDLAMDKAYVGMIVNAVNQDEAVRFIEYLLDNNYGSVN